MPKASKTAVKKPAAKKAAAKSAVKKPTLKAAPKKAAAKKPAPKLVLAPPKKAASAPAPKKAASKAQPVVKATEPVGMWKLLADKKAQAQARRDSQQAQPHASEDDRNRFAKHDTRFAKFAGPRRRAS